MTSSEDQRSFIKRWGSVIRLLMSAGLIGYLALTVDLEPLRDVLPLFKWTFYLCGVALMISYVFLQGYIIDKILGVRQINTTWLQMVRFNFISSFFGVFLPGGAGADVVMAVSLCKSAKDKAGVLSSILFARIAGLIAMVLIAFVVGVTVGGPVPGLNHVTFFILLAVIVCGVAHALGWFGVLHRSFFGLLTRGRLVDFLERFSASLGAISGSYRTMAIVVPAFLVMAFLRAVMDYLMARALGVMVPVTDFVVFSTVVSLVTLLPISIAGLGVREVTYAGLFSLVGVPQALAVSISLLSFSLSLVVCLIGGVLYATGGWRHRP